MTSRGRGVCGVHGEQLDDLAARGRLRTLAPRRGVDFSSNDYLGLAGSEVLTSAVREALERGVPVGATGSRLLRGNDPEHEALEAEAAEWAGSEAALYFSSGFAANAAILATLPQRGDLVVHDALVHASAHDGMKLGRAERVGFSHNDVEAAEAAIRSWRETGGRGRAWIVVESLYSMDGDRAPLDAFAALADRHEAMLVIDEAHAAGVHGDEGQGLAGAIGRRENAIVLRTCGKALGVEGALVTGGRTFIDFLINRGRGFIFSTAPSPLMAATVRAAIREVARPGRRLALAALVKRADDVFERLGIRASGSQIQPIILGADARAMAAAAGLQAQGFDVRGVRPPTVPEGTSRLRVSLTLNVEPADVERLGQALAPLLMETAA